MTAPSMNYLVELGRILRRDIHPEIFNGEGEELLRQVFQKGKYILASDARELARFRMVMYSRSEEFAPSNKRMQDGFIKRVKERGPIG